MAEPVQIITPALLDSLTERAKASERQRTNHNFHQSFEENPNRFLNVMVKGTYVTPHRHTTPPKSESFVVLRGQLLFITFDDDGGLQTVTRLSNTDNYGIDIEPGIWHSIIVESDTAICFEVKPGPYAPANDKDFAPWAPREGEADCDEYADDLLQRAMRHML
ncbi:MAG TPA: WbuC family cupin fold metalloprotein [Turneriella sp.]|nr:WbuC family cupin fold metalloprotein [Turneriella sp.]HNL53999.1 WbuC family cupin fold metalloprotein [Turneriella sp.]